MPVVRAMCVGLAVLTAPSRALAWGFEGHEIIAAIARAQMTPLAIAKVDAILASDPDTLTGPDMVSRATWADAWRNAGHRETAQWHFVDVELDLPDQRASCFGYPAPAAPPSSGPAQDCIVDKLQEFIGELGDPATTQPERLLALKYVLHFVGDVHQPLHASDNHDRGGNCVHVVLNGVRTTNLHSYWDTTVIEAMGSDPQAVATQLQSTLTTADLAAWRSGVPGTWAQESFAVAQAFAYTLGSPPGCGAGGAPIQITPAYDAQAQATAATQLKKAGVRLAMVLDRAFDPAAQGD